MSISDSEQHLWLQFKADKDQAAYAKLFETYAPWSRVVARDVYRRIRVSDLEWTDYVQNASIGLLEAMARFDVSRNIDFIAYAKPRVRGAVFNGLRSSLSAVNKRSINVDWYADRVESVSKSDGVDSLDSLISQVTGLALGMLLDFSSERESFAGASDPLRNAEHMQLETIIEEALIVLNQKERFVIEAHYYQHTAFVEIAELLGLSKGRVSQLHSTAIDKIRIALRARRNLRKESA